MSEDKFEPKKLQKQRSMEIEKFLKSKKKTLELRECPNVLSKALEMVGAEVNNDSLETNGWEYDWWLQARYKEQKLCVSGSGYYGYAAIEKIADEEEV
jgi:hypothetical protein